MHNWLRRLPYVRAWAEKYKDQGLVVIGVHAPEFAFEKDVANVRRAAKDMRVAYPIAIDNDHALWRAFNKLPNQTYVSRVDEEEHRRIEGNRLRRQFAHGHPSGRERK
jgi:hypothetical protein